MPIEAGPGEMALHAKNPYIFPQGDLHAHIRQHSLFSKSVAFTVYTHALITEIFVFVYAFHPFYPAVAYQSLAVSDLLSY